MKLNRVIRFLMLSIVTIQVSSCKKYLDAKPDQKLVIPTTIQDLQALLEFPNLTNDVFPLCAEVSAGDFYYLPTGWQSQDEYGRNMYTWQKGNLFSPYSEEWGLLYHLIYKTNIIMDHAGQIKRAPGDEAEFNNTIGCALFYRSYAYLQAAWTWSLAYDDETADTDLGVAYRANSNFNDPTARLSVRQTYQAVIEDAKRALTLLPAMAVHPFRPSKPAAHALLARTYLSMREYDKALLHADSCLQFPHKLIDYNNDPSITATATYPFGRFNAEVIFVAGASLNTPFTQGIPDSTLYDSYAATDLRRTLFFRSRNQTIRIFKGNYESGNGAGVLFTGLAADELYLTRAECLARDQQVAAALQDVNAVLEKRYATGTYTPFSTTDATAALAFILQERRKQLIYRGLRWMDIKRLNKDGANITLTRVIDGQEYTLPPNDLRYALAIPENVITISGLQQNPR